MAQPQPPSMLKNINQTTVAVGLGGFALGAMTIAKLIGRRSKVAAPRRRFLFGKKKALAAGVPIAPKKRSLLKRPLLHKNYPTTVGGANIVKETANVGSHRAQEAGTVMKHRALERLQKIKHRGEEGSTFLGHRAYETVTPTVPAKLGLFTRIRNRIRPVY